MNTRTRIRAAAAIMASAVTLAACGAGAKPVSSATHPSAAPTASAAPATTVAPTTTTTKPAPNLKAELLSLSQLPAGWSVASPPSKGGGGSTLGGCLPARRLSTTAKARAQVNYQGGSNGFPALQENIDYYSSAARATAAASAFQKALSGCHRFAYSSGGDPVTGTLGQMSMPTLGTGSAAYQIGLTVKTASLSVTFGMDLVAVRQGQTVASVRYEDFGTPSVAAFEHLAGLAAGKLAS